MKQNGLGGLFAEGTLSVIGEIIKNNHHLNETLCVHPEFITV